MEPSETTWDDAITLARQAIYDADGRGMVGRGRNHLVARVARALIHHERRLREKATRQPWRSNHG